MWLLTLCIACLGEDQPGRMGAESWAPHGAYRSGPKSDTHRNLDKISGLQYKDYFLFKINLIVYLSHQVPPFHDTSSHHAISPSVTRTAVIHNNPPQPLCTVALWLVPATNWLISVLDQCLPIILASRFRFLCALFSSSCGFLCSACYPPVSPMLT